MNNKNVYNDIMGRLRQTRRKESWIILLSGLFLALAITLSILYAGVIIENFANGDTTFRGILLGLTIFSGISLLGILSAPGVSRFLVPKMKPSLNAIALRVGEHYPDIKDRLCNAVQIYPLIDKPQGMSPELIEAAFEQITKSSQEKDFDVIVEKKKLKKSFFMLLIALFIFGGSLVFFPNSLGASLERIVNWDKSYLPPAPFTIQLVNKDQSVIRGNSAIIKIQASGTPPDAVSLFIKEEKQNNYDEFVLRLDSGDVYTYEIPATKTTLTYYAAAKWVGSLIPTETGTIKVIDMPQVRSLSGKVIFPGYTKLGTKSFDEQNADIAALAGSQAEIRILSNKELKSARIILEKNIFSREKTADSSRIDTLQVQMKINGKTAQGSFRVNFNGTYQVEITDKDGINNPDPIKYTVVSGTDGYPSISLLQPMMNVEVSKDAILPMKIAISDDYGFSNLKLYYRLTESKYSEPQKTYRTIAVPMLSGNNLSQEIPFVWDLNSINITPDDKYEFYLEVFDNDVVSGPKSSKSQVLTVRLPSLDEVSQQTDNMHEKVDKELQKILKESENLKKDMDELNRELLKKDKQKEMEWKDKKAAEDIMKKQADLKNRLNDVSKQVEQATNKLQQNNMMTPETLEKYMELQKLMQEVKSPELDKMQKQMENAMQNMTPDQMKKAMQEAKFDEEKFRKSIERTMKILKRLQAEQKADALAKRAEDLEKRQNDIEKQMQNANPNDKDKKNDLAQKQDALKKELESINKDLKELEKLMKDIGEQQMPMQEMAEAQESLDFDNTQEDMDQAGESMESGDFKKAGEKQKSASKKLKKFAKKMQDLKDKMQDKVKKEAERKMQKALQDMLTTSKQQEELKGKTQKSDYNSTQLPEYAKDQADNFDNLANIANSLSELGEKSFAVTPQMAAEVTNALQQMRNAVDYLANRQMAQGAQAQTQAMQSMNNSIGQMQSMLSQMQNKKSACENGSPGGSGQGQGSSGGVGFQQKLQQLAAQQQGINQAMQQMSGSGEEGGAMSQEKRSQMGKLADKQGGAQKSMEELAKEQKELAGGDKMALGNLNKIAQEMQEVAQDIRSGNITPETKRKQERILSRLLDATKSLHDRDFESKREAQSGKDFNKQSPDAIDFNKFLNKNQALDELLQNAKKGYTKDYENLIRKYFEAMRKQNVNVGN